MEIRSSDVVLFAAEPDVLQLLNIGISPHKMLSLDIKICCMPASEMCSSRCSGVFRECPAVVIKGALAS
jgi:hypothetical protein